MVRTLVYHDVIRESGIAGSIPWHHRHPALVTVIGRASFLTYADLAFRGPSTSKGGTTRSTRVNLNTPVVRLELSQRMSWWRIRFIENLDLLCKRLR